MAQHIQAVQAQRQYFNEHSPHYMEGYGLTFGDVCVPSEAAGAAYGMGSLL